MAENKIILCDTNILIELSKNNRDIIEELRLIGSDNIAVSAVSAGEFVFGSLNKKELAKIKKALKSIQILHVNESISQDAINLLEKHSLTHSLDVPDAFIAATGRFFNLELYTLNIKDFKYIEELILYKTKR